MPRPPLLTVLAVLGIIIALVSLCCGACGASGMVGGAEPQGLTGEGARAFETLQATQATMLPVNVLLLVGAALTALGLFAGAGLVLANAPLGRPLLIGACVLGGVVEALALIVGAFTQFLNWEPMRTVFESTMEAQLAAQPGGADIDVDSLITFIMGVSILFALGIPLVRLLYFAGTALYAWLNQGVATWQASLVYEDD